MVVSSIESFFLAGLSLRLQWSYIGPADPVVSDLLSVATMDSLHTVTLPSTIPRGTYSVTLTATNWLNQTTARTVSVEAVFLPVPLVEITEQDRRVVTSQEYTLRGVIVPDLCFNSTLIFDTILHTWKVFIVEEEDGTWNELATIDGSTQNLFIPAFTLPPATYVMQLIGTDTRFSLSGSAFVQVTVESQEVVAIIDGGSRVQVGQPQVFVLDATRSFDPDASDGVIINMQVEWTCDDGCLDGQGFNLSSPILPVSNLPLGLHTVRLLVTAPAFDDTPARTASTTIRLEVLPSSIAIATIRPLAVVELAHEPIVLEGACLDSNGVELSNFRVKWSTNAIDIDDTTTLLGKRNRNFIILPHTLLPGSFSSFSLSCFDQSGSLSRGRSSIVVQTRPVPVEGDCFIEPSSGFALATPFRLFCAGWETEQGEEFPPKFYFRYIDRFNKEVSLAEGITTATGIVTGLPAGDPLHVVFYIQEHLGGVRRLLKEVTVDAPFSEELVFFFVVDRLRNLTFINNSEQALVFISNLLHSHLRESFIDVALRDALLELIVFQVERERTQYSPNTLKMFLDIVTELFRLNDDPLDPQLQTTIIAQILDFASDVDIVAKGVVQRRELNNGLYGFLSNILRRVRRGIELEDDLNFLNLVDVLQFSLSNLGGSLSAGQCSGFATGDLTANVQRSFVDDLRSSNIGPGACLSSSVSAFVTVPTTFSAGVPQLSASSTVFPYQLFGVVGNNAENLASDTLSVNFHGLTISDLPEPIVLSFTLSSSSGSRQPQCVFWDPVALRYSSAGCSVDFSSNTEVRCKCDHTTSFGVLLGSTGGGGGANGNGGNGGNNNGAASASDLMWQISVALLLGAVVVCAVTIAVVLKVPAAYKFVVGRKQVHVSELRTIVEQKLEASRQSNHFGPANSS